MTYITDTSKWPKRTYTARWARILGVSIGTMDNKKKRDGLLGEGEKALNGRVFYTKEEICWHSTLRTMERNDTINTKERKPTF